jgi:phosphoglycolate phosphatase-like HAD superfamily hydrolase
MKTTRRTFLNAAATLSIILLIGGTVFAQTDPLPSWNDGAAKKAVTDFVAKTTTSGSPDFVPPAERIATFDMDGTLLVEKPLPAQAEYCFARVFVLAQEKPEFRNTEPFKTILSGDQAAIAKLSEKDLLKIVAATLTGITVEQFQAQVKEWVATGKDPRWKQHFTDLAYQPMLEVLKYLRANGYKTYICTGSGQDFVRVFAEQTFGIPPEQVIGSMGGTSFGYDKDGKPILTKEPKLMLNDDKDAKPQAIHLMIGRRPRAAFGNSNGDQQMLEYTKAGDGARLAMIVLHDDAAREYAYGPAQGLPATKMGYFTQALYDEAQKDGWMVISMKNDWKQVFAFEKQSTTH